MNGDDLQPVMGALVAAKVILEVDDCTPLEDRVEAAREYLDDAMEGLARAMELARRRDSGVRAVGAAWAGRASSN